MKHKQSVKKRIWSIFLVCVMLVSMIPTSVFAEETITETETVVETVAETPVADNVTETTEAATTPETQISSLDEISDNTEESLSNEDTTPSQETDSEILSGGARRRLSQRSSLTDLRTAYL